MGLGLDFRGILVDGFIFLFNHTFFNDGEGFLNQ